MTSAVSLFFTQKDEATPFYNDEVMHKVVNTLKDKAKKVFVEVLHMVPGCEIYNIEIKYDQQMDALANLLNEDLDAGIHEKCCRISIIPNNKKDKAYLQPFNDLIEALKTDYKIYWQQDEKESPTLVTPEWLQRHLNG